MEIDYGGFIAKLDAELVRRCHSIVTRDDLWILVHSFDYFLTVDETIVNILHNRTKS